MPDDVAALHARIAKLEKQNEDLRAAVAVTVTCLNEVIAAHAEADLADAEEPE